MVANQLRLGSVSPQVSDGAWVAPTAMLIGDVTVFEGATVWYGSVLRADGDLISIGRGSNIQDGCVLHADPSFPVIVGEDVSIGHRAVLHGCCVEDGVLIGMSAVVMNGAHVSSGSIVAAGSVVLEGSEVPANTLVAGVPAKVRRQITDRERDAIRRNALTYCQAGTRHRDATA